MASNYWIFRIFLIVALLTPGSSLAKTASPSASSSSHLSSPITTETIQFAIVGDYGADNTAEESVAKLIKSWNPQFIITLGDNNYSNGETVTIDQNIGKYYHEFIYNYQGRFGEGSKERRFYPSLGNHDWDCKTCTPIPRPYLKYFSLEDSQRYYDFVRGPVHFFALDSDSREPDGNTTFSKQANWLKEKLAQSKSPFKVVFFHHPPYTTGTRGDTIEMKWPFKTWGASIVIAGHDHHYERLEVDQLPYIVNGLGGAGIPYLDFAHPHKGSKLQYNKEHGALLIKADQKSITFDFINKSNVRIDHYVLHSAERQFNSKKAAALTN